MPITAQEALEATNPALPEEERQKAAEQIMAGVAANDAYLNSRSPIEQAIALAKGGQVAEPHDVREARASDTATGTDIVSTAVADADKVGSEVEKAGAEEIRALESRLSELKSQLGL